MTQGEHPVLTVRAGQVQHSFTSGGDSLIVGSDRRADVRVAHPLVADAHLLLRFEHGGWRAIDNNSASGIFVGGSRVSSIDIGDGLVVNLGRPDGPRVTFEVSHLRGFAGLLPPTDPIPTPRDRPHRPPTRFRPPLRPHDPDTTA